MSGKKEITDIQFRYGLILEDTSCCGTVYVRCSMAHRRSTRCGLSGVDTVVQISLKPFWPRLVLQQELLH